MGVPLSLSSVPATTPYIQYIATASQTVFPYPFPITQDADLIVVVGGVTQPTDSGYTLSGQGNPTGGNVTFTVGISAGVIVTLFRNIAIQRLTQIGQSSGYQSSAFNAEFNNIYLILQQLQEAQAFMLTIPLTNSPAPVTTLTPAAYAGKFLSFDANGNPQAAVVTGGGGGGGSITAAQIASLLNAGGSLVNNTVITVLQTAAEVAAAVTPTDTTQPATNNFARLSRYAGNLASAIAVASSNRFTLYIDQPAVVGANMTVPATMQLVFDGNGSLSVSNTFTLNVNGLVVGNAPLATLFIGAGTTVLGEAGIQFLNGGLVATGGAATPEYNVGNSSTAFTLDCSKSNVFRLTMTGNVTGGNFTISNPKDGQTVNVYITQDGTGTRTLAYPATVKWSGGVAGVLSTPAASVDLLTMQYRAASNTWNAALTKAFA